MINISKITEYNRIVAYTRGRYHPWDDKEKQAMIEAAPLLRFTLGKIIRAAEDEHINIILNYAAKTQASHVLITNKTIQLMIDQSSHNTLDMRYVDRGTMMYNLGLNTQYFAADGMSIDSSLKIASLKLPRYEPYISILPNDTKKAGLYVLNGSNMLIKGSKTLAVTYDQMGYVTQPGIPPTVVHPDEMSKQEMSRVLDVLNFCGSMGTTSVWAKALAKPLRKCITQYRSPETIKHAALIKTIIAAAKGYKF